MHVPEECLQDPWTMLVRDKSNSKCYQHVLGSHGLAGALGVGGSPAVVIKLGFVRLPLE